MLMICGGYPLSGDCRSNDVVKHQRAYTKPYPCDGLPARSQENQPRADANPFRYCDVLGSVGLTSWWSRHRAKRGAQRARSAVRAHQPVRVRPVMGMEWRCKSSEQPGRWELRQCRKAPAREGGAEESGTRKLRVDEQPPDTRRPRFHGERTYDRNPYRPKELGVHPAIAQRSPCLLPGEISLCA